jgi:hypothetical protein
VRRDEVDDGDRLGFVAVASGAGFGCLDQGVDAFEQAVAQVVFVPGEDAVEVFLDQGDEVFDGLQAGAFGAGAPASQVLGGVAGVLVVEGLEVLSPAQCPGGGQLRGGAHQPVEVAALPRREVRPVLQSQPAGVFEFRAGGDLLAAYGVNRFAELGGQVAAVEGHCCVRLDAGRFR